MFELYRIAIMSGKCQLCGKWFIFHTDQRVETENGGLVHASCRAQRPHPQHHDHQEQQQQQDYWNCLLCAHQRNPMWRRSCAVCLSHRGQQHQVLPPPALAPPPVFWRCVICDSENQEPSTECAQCNEAVEKIRWTCAVCTLNDNHWFADRCAACMSPRGAPAPLPPPPPPPVLVAGTAQQTLVPPQQTFECMSCSDPAIPLSERYAISADCSPASSNCKSCVAGWLASQIDGGNAAALTCPCGGRHHVRYANIRDLGSLLPNRSLEIYSRAMRSAASSAPVGVPSLVAVSCPDCDAEYQVAPRQDYRCTNPRCFSSGSLICGRHYLRHSRLPVAAAAEGQHYSGSTFLSSMPICVRCLEEASGNVAVMEARTSILDAFVDHCPACRGVVGEPESFDNCMCLKCRHCPANFCGYCYVYHGGWGDTHTHVRSCRYNDRRNFYCPEPVWRDLMRQRRLRLLDNILNAPALDLTAAQKDELRQWAETLL